MSLRLLITVLPTRDWGGGNEHIISYTVYIHSNYKKDFCDFVLFWGVCCNILFLGVLDDENNVSKIFVFW